MKVSLSGPVAAALDDGRGVVALESTVVAHGLPYPQNLQTAVAREEAIVEKGAVPATMAVLGGRPCAGLDRDQLHRLATSKDFRKISRRDLPIAVANKLDCATTVATTAFLAHGAGIRVFATGGIGGVHRGNDGDVSGDLPELARTPIVVVCSGAKIVLDLPATREWLETFGITVLGWQCDEMPGFYSRSTGLEVDERVESAAQVAAVAAARDDLGLSNTILVTVPVPAESEIPRDECEAILNESLKQANADGIRGKQITPYLLSKMSELSGGRTLDANIALLKKNAGVGAEIANAIASTV